MAAAVLVDFPFKNQLAERDPNDRMDCVAVSFASAIQWLTHLSVTGAMLKDAEYGRSYLGGTALRRYVDEQSDLAIARYGCSAAHFEAEPVQLVAKIHSYLRQGFPVIATIPSDWATPRTAAQLDDPSFSTHCICFYGETAGYSGLRAMNPWKAMDHIGSDDYWDKRVCERQAWRVFRIAGGAPMWKKGSDGWYRDSKGHKAGGTVGSYLLSHGYADVDALGDQVYYSGADAFLALKNGAIVTSHKNAQTGQWAAQEGEGAALLTRFYGQATTAAPVSAPAPRDPKDAAARTLMDGIVAYAALK
jgi:hypothetical protein